MKATNFSNTVKIKYPKCALKKIGMQEQKKKKLTALRPPKYPNTKQQPTSYTGPYK